MSHLEDMLADFVFDELSSEEMEAARQTVSMNDPTIEIPRSVLRTAGGAAPAPTVFNPIQPPRPVLVQALPDQPVQPSPTNSEPASTGPRVIQTPFGPTVIQVPQ